MFTRLRGEIYLFLGAFLFAFNGIISKIVLLDEISAWRLTQIRTGGAFVILFTFFIIFRRKELKPTKQELPWLILFGVVGVTLVQAFYFVAIERMYVGIALLIEFTAPIWILLFLRFVLKKHVPQGLWYAIALAFTGLLMITQIWDGLTVDQIGLIAAFLDALALAGYFLIGDLLGKTKSSGAIATWGFGVASLLLFFALPIWNFPVDALTNEMNLLGRFEDYSLPGWVLVLWIVVMGTIAPYLFVIAGLKILSASTASVFGMIEPVMAGIFAWWWLNERLTTIQLIGALVVLIGISIADRARQHTPQN
ncbi:MAG: DMT family transporter, partial [Candidatus Nanopelagicaceae bacterium]